MVSLKSININSEKPNFDDIIEALTEVQKDLPFYFLGFVYYSNQMNYKRYLLIKLYKYLELINPHKNNDLNFKMELYFTKNVISLTSIIFVI